MKIGIDARLWNQTGVGRYIRNLVDALSQIDKKNDYVLFTRAQDNVKFKNSNFKIVNTEIKWHSIDEQLKFSKVITEQNLDVIHFPYYSVPVFYNKPFIVTLHDLIPMHFQTGKASTLPFPFYKFKFFAYRFVVSQAAKKAKKIIAPSFATKQDIVKRLKINPSKIEVIYEGTDKSLVSKQSGETKKTNQFLYIGNAYPHKNLDLLLNVFKDLPFDFKLTLVGKEDYFYKRLKQKVKKIKLENKIFFQGYASDLELLTLYKKSKALIIPSFIEGFGLPALEAMANKCLVLASDIPTLREVCDGAALFFDPKNSDELLRKIIEISNNSDKFKKYVDQGIRRSNEFSWEKTAKETLKIYEGSSSASSE